MMTSEDYIEKRVDQDFKFYDTKAGKYRKAHLRTRIAVILFSALIAVFSNLDFEFKNIIVSILSSFIIVIVGVSELMKYREQWLEYRTTAETIKSEKLLYLTNTAPYAGADNFHTYVKNHEAIGRNENSTWKSFFSKKDNA